MFQGLVMVVIFVIINYTIKGVNDWRKKKKDDAK